MHSVFSTFSITNIFHFLIHSLSPGGKDIQEKLEKATSRRRSLVQNRLEKVADHIRMVEMRRSQENLYTSLLFYVFYNILLQ